MPGLQAHHAIAGSLYLMTAIDADGEHSHSLKRSRAVERACINWAQAFDEFHGFHHSRFRFLVIACDKHITIEQGLSVSEQMRGLCLESCDERNLFRQSCAQVF